MTDRDLLFLYGKRARVTLKTGETYVGFVDGFTPVDDEAEGATIDMQSDQFSFGFASIRQVEILHAEVIDTP